MFKDDSNLWAVAGANLVGSGDRSVGQGASSVIAGRYRIERVLGAGASATAFAAIDDVTGERRVLKAFHPQNPAAGQRAVAEFRRLHELSHPCIVRVRDLVRIPEGPLYLVTDEIQGPAITSLAELTSTDARRAAFAGAAHDLADALAYLHGRGVVHGDLAPNNARLDASGRPVLLDFDLAGPGRAASAAGGASGTLGYASPEAL